MPGKQTVTISPTEPSFGGTLMFEVTNPADMQMVETRATQNGVIVYREISSYYRGDNQALLGPTPRWSGGPAEGELFLGTGGNRLTFNRRPSLTFPIKG